MFLTPDLIYIDTGDFKLVLMLVSAEATMVFKRVRSFTVNIYFIVMHTSKSFLLLMAVIILVLDFELLFLSLWITTQKQQLDLDEQVARSFL